MQLWLSVPQTGLLLSPELSLVQVLSPKSLPHLLLLVYLEAHLGGQFLETHLIMSHNVKNDLTRF